jgi:hypothetical protein
MRLRGTQHLRRERYAPLAAAFASPDLAYSSGMRQRLCEIQRMYPPAPPTWRGRLGKAVIAVQARVLWWIPWAMGRRDGLLEWAVNTIAAQDRLIRDLDRRIAALETRKSADGGMDGHTPKD